MLKKLPGAILISAFVMTADATITASLVDLGAPLGEGTYTYDIVVTLTDGPEPGDPDDWTVAGMRATLDSGAVFINEDLFNPPLDPTTYPYDSFFTSPQWYPNSDEIGFIQYLGPVVEQDQLRALEWFDIVDTGNGDFVINRLSIQGDGAPATLRVELLVGAFNTGGTIFPFEFEVAVPEPGGLMLLGMGILGLIRRR